MLFCSQDFFGKSRQYQIDSSFVNDRRFPVHDTRSVHHFDRITPTTGGGTRGRFQKLGKKGRFVPDHQRWQGCCGIRRRDIQRHHTTDRSRIGRRYHCHRRRCHDRHKSSRGHGRSHLCCQAGSRYRRQDTGRRRYGRTRRRRRSCSGRGGCRTLGGSHRYLLCHHNGLLGGGGQLDIVHGIATDRHGQVRRRVSSRVTAALEKTIQEFSHLTAQSNHSTGTQNGKQQTHADLLFVFFCLVNYSRRSFAVFAGREFVILIMWVAADGRFVRNVLLFLLLLCFRCLSCIVLVSSHHELFVRFQMHILEWKRIVILVAITDTTTTPGRCPIRVVDGRGSVVGHNTIRIRMSVIVFFHLQEPGTAATTSSVVEVAMAAASIMKGCLEVAVGLH